LLIAANGFSISIGKMKAAMREMKFFRNSALSFLILLKDRKAPRKNYSASSRASSKTVSKKSSKSKLKK